MVKLSSSPLLSRILKLIPSSVSGGAPNYAFFGGLQEGTTVDVSSLLAYLIPAAVDIPQITLDSFDFYCQPSATSPVYSIQAMLTSDWTLAVGPTSLAITEGWVNVTYCASASAP